MITDELKKLVADEAVQLVLHATQEEKSRLDLITVDPASARRCIYGQMTGYCFSYRAEILLNQCALPFSELSDHFSPTSDEVFWCLEFRSFSPIEFYINCTGANIALLTNFIKGLTETLTPEML